MCGHLFSTDLDKHGRGEARDRSGRDRADVGDSREDAGDSRRALAGGRGGDRPLRGASCVGEMTNER